MAVTLPNEIQELRSFLKQGAGMTTVSTIQHEGFGDICMTLANETVQVRFVRDRGQWSIQLAPAGETETYYDDHIIREMLTGDACDAPSSLAQMAETLMEHWNAIAEAFAPKSVDLTEKRLKELLDARGRRMFPGWHD